MPVDRYRTDLGERFLSLAEGHRERIVDPRGVEQHAIALGAKTFLSCRHPDWTEHVRALVAEAFKLMVSARSTTAFAAIGRALQRPGPAWVFETIRAIGLDALRPPLEPQDALFGEALGRDAWFDLRRTIWTTIEQWWSDTRLGSPDTARGAAKNLQRLGVVLAADRRGRPHSTKDPSIMRARYVVELYRLSHAHALLAVRPYEWARTPRERLRQVADACDLKYDDVRQLSYLDHTGRATPRRKERLEHLKRLARVRVARQAGCTEQTVGNTLARADRWPVRSRK